jgi:hypothetical protein
MALQRQLLKRATSDIYHRRAISLLRTDFSTSPSIADAPPHIPPFVHQPRPYKGPSADEVLQKRKKFLGPSLFHYYQKPVRPFMFSFSRSADTELRFCYIDFGDRDLSVRNRGFQICSCDFRSIH